MRFRLWTFLVVCVGFAAIPGTWIAAVRREYASEQQIVSDLTNRLFFEFRSEYVGPRFGQSYFSKQNWFHRVVDVTIADDRMIDRDMEIIADLRYLEALQLNSCNVSDAGLRHLNQLTNLQRANLAQCRISDDGLRTLAFRKRLLGLTLWQTPISNEAIPHLLDCRKLDELNIGETLIDDDGLIRLSEIRTLTYLYVVGCNVSADAVEALKSKRPALNVEWGAY